MFLKFLFLTKGKSLCAQISEHLQTPLESMISFVGLLCPCFVMASYLQIDVISYRKTWKVSVFIPRVYSYSKLHT